jgi:hypothetical protein
MFFSASWLLFIDNNIPASMHFRSANSWADPYKKRKRYGSVVPNELELSLSASLIENDSLFFHLFLEAYNFCIDSNMYNDYLLCRKVI